MMNRSLFRFGCAALFAGMLAAQPALAQDKKVALVIGNSEYKNVFSLKNPVNDAADVGAALLRVGFAVSTVNNGTAADMKRALKTFGDKAKLADVAVVFYSGHALQSDGVAWLLATDGQARSLADVTKGSISLPEIVEQLDGAEKIGMVFLDAARNDPFNEGAKRQLPSGLVKQVEEPKNVLISYATGAGRKVADGEGRNSPFTAALLKHIEEPGLELIALMKRVRDEVMRATANEQVPTFYISATDDVYFVAALPQPPAPEVKPQPAPPAAAPQAALPAAPALIEAQTPAEAPKPVEIAKPVEAEKPAEPAKQVEAAKPVETPAETPAPADKAADGTDSSDKPKTE